MFLDDKRVGTAIADLLKTRTRLRCAVAFWGNGAAKAMFGNEGIPSDAQIVCDLSMGGSNPNELRKLGAPDNKNLKHHPGLHAKVYLAETGVITASANASNNGLGFLGTAALTEAGSFHSPESEAFRSAEEWFERLWDNAGMIDKRALAFAQAAWDQRKRGSTAPIPPSFQPHSLFGAVVADPLSYRGVGFAFATRDADDEERCRAVDGVVKRTAGLRPKDVARVEKWPPGDVFSDWPGEDVAAWPLHFVCVYRPRERLSYVFYRREYTTIFDGKKAAGSVLASRPRGLRKQLGFKHGAAAMASADEELAGRIFDYLKNHENEHWLCESGEKLRGLLGRVGR